MKARLAAFGLVVAVFLVIHWCMPEPRRVDMTADDPSIHLVPDRLGPYQASVRWNHRLQGGFDVENGASYARPGADESVQLDFFRVRIGRHHGLACHLVRGEVLRAEQVQTLSARDESGVFDVAVFRDDRSLRLVAVTQCSAGRCFAEPLPRWSELFGQWAKNLLVPAERVVPVSVSIARPAAADAERAVRAQLQEDLARAIAGLELGPARRLAGLGQAASPPSAAGKVHD